MSDNYTIRKVRAGDEIILAQIQTESWKAAFKGIIQHELLEAYTDFDRVTAMYRRLLDNNKGNGYILEVEDKAHCIAWWDSAREQDMPGYAEIICIHSLQNQWRRGYGSRMMDRLLEDIAEAGYMNTMLWVFDKNERAKMFYTAKGFVQNDRSKMSCGAREVMFVKRNT